MTRLVLLLALMFGMLPSSAQERIVSYDSEVDIRADGSLDVVERIAVRAEGNNIRRGIYRDFPTRYRDRYGNRVVVDFEVLGVQRDGRDEPWFTENIDNGVRVNTGNDDFLAVPADYTYTLRYRTTRQLGFFDDHDELYWNAIGLGWMFAIERGSVAVRLPSPVPQAQLTAEAYSGREGAREQDFEARIVAPGSVRWTLTGPLQPYEGLSIVLSFPKGVVAEPTRTQRLLWLLEDNRAALIALAGLIVLLVYCLRRWHAVGRDPRPGTIITRYGPPEGISPGGLRYVSRMKYDNRCFSADLLASAVDGHVRIEREDGLFKDTWTLRKTAAPGDEISTREQRTLLDGLFSGRGEVELRNTNAAIMQSALRSHTESLDKRFHPAMFKRNGRNIAIACAIAGVSAVLAILFGSGTGTGVLLAIPVILAMIVVVIVFGVLVKAPTIEGRKLMDEIEGLKSYLSVAERDDLARLQGPDATPALDAERFERLLPYAVALEVEDAWTEKFTHAVGAAAAAAATSSIGWYHGGGTGDLGSLTRSIGSSLTSQISSSSTPPGSSSGGGGGGSSGGGGGGGGGGGR